MVILKLTIEMWKWGGETFYSTPFSIDHKKLTAAIKSRGKNTLKNKSSILWCFDSRNLKRIILLLKTSRGIWRIWFYQQPTRTMFWLNSRKKWISVLVTTDNYSFELKLWILHNMAVSKDKNEYGCQRVRNHPSQFLLYR